jgi:hypothetical protein
MPMTRGAFRHFVRGLFGARNVPSVSPEVEAIFKKVESFLADEDAQVARLPVELQEEIAENTACDFIPNGTGSFGKSIENPIPVNGPLGQALYLSSVRVNLVPIMFHRLGSFSGIDIFEIVSLDGGVWDIFFLSLYFPRRSRKAPSGYTVANNAPVSGRIYGTTARVEPFPHGLYEAVRQFTVRSIGVPLPNREVREALHRQPFVSPETHRRRIDELIRSRMQVALTDHDLTT